ncbi:MAG TPA: VOC family protein [Hyphomonas sp.]|nr:VOC family protein [Hyphomonas sp.]HPE47359.1 VOC family protein [Hyphomonas sp.]
MTLEQAKLRVARPTDDIDALLPFYRDGLGFEVLFEFRGHDDFDGVMLGHPGAPFHLEFTRAHGHAAGRAPTQDNLLVFYLPEQNRLAAATARLRATGFEPVPSFNPYWDEGGVTFEDPDGYRVVLFGRAWAI